MKRGKLLAVAVAIAFASVTFGSEASAGVTGIIIYLGQNPYVYCPYPNYSYGYYPVMRTSLFRIGEATGGGIP